MFYRERVARLERKTVLTVEEFGKILSERVAVTHAKSTIQIYKRSLHNLRKVVGNIDIRKLIHSDGERFKLSRADEVSLTTVNIELRALKAAFNMAVNLDYLSENPFKKVKLLKIPYEEPKFLTKDEFQKLVGIIRDEDIRDIVIVGVLTMLRRGELINLTWDDIDFNHRFLRIRSKDGFKVKGGRPRIVPMNAQVEGILRRRIEKKNSEYVFTNSKNSRFTGSYITKTFKKYVRECALSEGTHFHSLRHTGASWMAQDGVPLFHVQKILGHSSVKVTEIYSHVIDESLYKAVKNLHVDVDEGYMSDVKELVAHISPN